MGRGGALRESVRRAGSFGDYLRRFRARAGPGGVGKTRLALQVTVGFAPPASGPRKALFVELASISEAERVVATIARAAGVPYRDEAQTHEALATRFRDHPALLVLDNFEQLLPAA